MRRLLTFVLAATLALSGCSFGRPKPAPSRIYEAGGTKLVAAVREGRIAVYDGKGWSAPFWAGVNLGATTPGHAPGELSPRKADYRRWFPQMKAMNARVLRVYTILPPEFYAALAEFNAGQQEPLWLVQGIWSPEEELIGHQEQGSDAFTPAITAAFRQEISNAVRAVHGDVVLPQRPGHASGTYTADVSPYLLGWLVGTEWHQRAVKVTNDAHPGMAPYRGQYFAARDGAAPFESWLAQMLDHAATEEMRYGWQHPMAFTNWPTTDVLAHPEEANPEEDLVSVDPTMVAPTAAWRAGYFAAYHIYPYYPDFMRYEPRYQGYRNLAGQPDPYAGYLHEIRQHHKDLPFIVAEFGVPSSRGMAHLAPLDRHQGMHTEQEQGRLNADLLANIHHEGFDGAFVFAWQDEWHKFTWNTNPLEQPADRRPMWRNRLTNEEHFGLVAVEAGRPGEAIYLDGRAEDWAPRRVKASHRYEGFDLTVTHDEAYLYLLFQKPAGTWESLTVGLSTLGAGSRTADKAPGVTLTRPAEFLLQLKGEDSHLYVNSAYDQHTYQWGEVGRVFPVDSRWKNPEAGLFLPWKLLLNRTLKQRQSGTIIPYEELEVGRLRSGVTDPASPRFNSLADWYAEGGVLEVRIPWMLLGFTDPSSLQVWQYPYKAGGIQTAAVDGVWIEPTGGAPLHYQWEPWNQTTWYERLKPSYEAMAKAFATYREVKGRPSP